MDWNKHQEHCKKLPRGSLAVISNAKEQKAVETYLKRKEIQRW